MKVLKLFLKAFLDPYGVNRRVILFITVYMTWKSFEWAAHFAGTSTKSGLEEAAIIAAVTAPISALQGFVFKVYTESRPERSNADTTDAPK
jgi:hypothetical protein